jgi:hypothetical protein
MGPSRAPIAPLSAADVEDLAEHGVFETRRGSVPWDVHELCELLRRLSWLALAASAWIQSLDINPLAVTRDGFVAVDGLWSYRTGPILHQPRLAEQ